MKRPAKKRKAEYRKRIEAKAKAGELPTKDVHILDVYHDARCAIFSGKDCNCDPEIRIRLLGDPETAQDKASQ